MSAILAKASETDVSPIVKLTLVFFGLAFFLYGMKIMGEGLEGAAGNKFKKILGVATKNRVIGALTGTVLCAVIQSSSAVTAMLVGFVNAGLMELTQTVGAIMGANIGTTVTAFIAASGLEKYAKYIIIASVLVLFFARKDTLRYGAQIFVGLGVLFYGMDLMKGNLSEFQEYLQPVFEQTKNPLLGILLGFAVTAILQSSSVVTGILVALGAAGSLDLPSAIFIVYGSNIGACMTSFLASIGATREARKVSVVCFEFNIIGTVLFTIISLPIFPYIGWLESIPGGVKMQIAISHTLFNSLTTIALLPAAGILVKIANKIIPVKEGKDDHLKLLHLDNRFLNPPNIAVEASYKEIERMAALALQNYKMSVDLFLNRNTKNLEDIKKNEKTINFLNHEITGFLIKISALELNEKERNTIGSFYHVVNDIERVGDLAENIMEFSADYIENPNMFSEAALGELKGVAEQAQEVLESSITLFSGRVYNQEEIDRILANEEEVDDKFEQAKDNHIERLNKHVCSPTSGMLFINMLSDLERVSDHAANIALSLRFRMTEEQTSELVEKALS